MESNGQPPKAPRLSRQKRGKGDGTIGRRGDGRWEARLTLPGGRRKSFYGATRQEVQSKLAKARYEFEERGVEPADERTTVAQYFSTWLEQVKLTIQPTTWIRYEYQSRLHILPHLGTVRLARLSPSQVQSLYGILMADDGLGASAARGVHAVLHRALADAVRLGVVTRNVADATRPPRPRKHEMRPLEPQEAAALVATANLAGDRRAAFWTLALATGMRVGEMLALTWKDLDLARAKVSVQRTLFVKRGGYEMKEAKTRTSRRSIRIGPDVVTALRVHRTNQAELRLAAGPSWHDLGLVFAREDGYYVRPQRIGIDLDRALKRAGLKHIRVHDLRHTAATLALRAGEHPKKVSEMLGHSSVAITMDRYSHVTPDMQESLAEAMNKMLFG